MDNITGKANWFQEETDVIEEEVIVEEVVPYVPLELTALRDFLKETTDRYNIYKLKQLGDAIVHLEIANKILSN